MFGYVIFNCKTLPEEDQARFRAFYCGLCRTLRERYAELERFTLSYDMTFLALLLSALYEPEEAGGEGRCLPHPFRKSPFVRTEFSDYAADLNVLLTWHKFADDVQDDRKLLASAAARIFRASYEKACERRPKQSEIISGWMRRNAEVEAGNETRIDIPMNLTGDMLGSLFALRDDCWHDTLFALGAGLGRFIYFMDAYEDLDADIRRGRYNPLRALRDQSDFEELCRQSMTLMLADAADAFERLPILRDAQLIRNILYSGVWSKYAQIQNKRHKNCSETDRKES